ncbi:MAG: glucuronyl hydrolase [Citrobacter freundii]|nr:MAG: glucuronyl hydrolase [Citrobacter freundii]
MKKEVLNIILISSVLVFCFCSTNKAKQNDYAKALDYCVIQATKTAGSLHNTSVVPRSIANGQRQWRLVDRRDWTSGFWPGIEWYLYEYTKDEIWRTRAGQDQHLLAPLVDSSAIDHDIGFVMSSSYGNGYRLTGKPEYKEILLRAADTLSKLYNPRTGTILSWPRPVPGVDWPLRHNTIMDNMINLELLFWAAKEGANKKLYDIAVSHAATTMENHFRPDYSSYHVVLYDTASGKKVKGITHQGYSDSSMWARGQAWAIYGFTMVYRETREKRFLEFAQKVTDVYLSRLPKDLIPFWDFNDPEIPASPKDASAACIVASALFDLSTFVGDKAKSSSYRAKAETMLKELSAHYQSRDLNNAFLLHSTGNKPAGSEIDASIVYADYYYIEALLKARKIYAKENSNEP